VLPTSSSDGLIEFVPSFPLAAILSEHRTIHRFLGLHQPDSTGPYGLKAEALSTFVRSCAGYSVMTYVLGVGDRHLDNLLLTTEGRLFHIDFGFILGNDPKPFPPPMKLCREMVDAMGGQDSEHYRRFQTLCCEAYNILRKSAGLLASLMHLMAGSSIAQIADDPEMALLKLQEKLRPDLSDEEAAVWMTQLLSDSASAVMPQFIEATHRWAQYWR
jgi:phosphatidylinositol 3-kinase